MDGANSSKSQLVVCFQPPCFELQTNQTVLSFLSPTEENFLAQTFRGSVLSGRELINRFVDRGREIYLKICSDIGIATFSDGRTLRQAMYKDSFGSLWWSHPISAKNCERDPAFTLIVQSLAILHAAKEGSFGSVKLVGAPRQIYGVLASSGLNILGRKTQPLPSFSIARSIINRFLKAIVTLIQVLFKSRPHDMPLAFDVAMCGFLDWSVSVDQQSGVQDKYFKKLPDELSNKLISYGWLLWKDYRGYISPKLFARAVHPSNVIVLQDFLTLADVLRSFFRFNPLLFYLKMRYDKNFYVLFEDSDINYISLFKTSLLSGFIDWSLPHGELVSKAIQRAILKHKIKLVLTFQEHFLHSRPIYQGCSRKHVLSATMQHASYNKNKTFLHFSPKTEFKGHPDGIKAPHPDFVFAMGGFGKELFLSCGYKPEQIFVTGSANYDLASTVLEPPLLNSKRKSAINTSDRFVILIACTMLPEQEIDMVEAAVSASEGLGKLELIVRNHPHGAVSNHKRFKTIADKLEVSSKTLVDDLDRADLLLFTQTTVAEEAYIRSVPVWQWMTYSPDASALSQLADIPQFYDVPSLREAFSELDSLQDLPHPTQQERDDLIRQLFNKLDHGAAARIASIIGNVLVKST